MAQLEKLWEELQQHDTTDAARQEFLQRAESDRRIVTYLATHLPSLVEQGPNAADSSPWINVVIETIVRKRVLEAELRNPDGRIAERATVALENLRGKEK